MQRRVEIAWRDTTLWRACAEMAAQRYELIYRATVSPRPERFYVLRETDAAGQVTGVSACVGATTLSERTTFCDHYAGGSVTSLLSEAVGELVDRDEVVEIGSLASNRGGGGKYLVRILPALSWCCGARFFVCTATPEVVDILAATGSVFHPLIAADVNALPVDQRDGWGTYYDTRPIVGYVDLRRYEQLSRPLAVQGEAA